MFNALGDAPTSQKINNSKKMQDTTGKPIETMLSVKPTTLTIYGYWHGIRTQTHKVTDLDNKPKGVLSDKAKRRLRDSCNWLYLLNERKNTINSTNKRLVFLTLTLPSKQRHTDKEIKAKILNHFLLELKQQFSLSMYVWRAERQINGNIHFHLIVDCYMPKDEVRKIFNRICSKLGYILPYQEKMKKMSFDNYVDYRIKTDAKKQTVEQYKDAYLYGQKTEWKQPPTTDVRGVKDLKQLTNYLSKYISKDAENLHLRPVDGRIWFCSSELSKIRGCSVSVDEILYKELIKVVDGNKAHTITDNDSGFVCFCLDFSKWYGKAIMLTDVVNTYLDMVINDIDFNVHLFRGYVPDKHKKEPSVFVPLALPVFNYEQLKIF